MLFGKRYRYSPDGLLELAANLASAIPKPQRQALNALRKDRGLRDAVNLVVVAFEVADEQSEAGTFRGDPVELETLRPIAAIVARLGELRSTSDERARAAATTVLELLREEAPARGGSSPRRGLTSA